VLIAAAGQVITCRTCSVGSGMNKAVSQLNKAREAIVFVVVVLLWVVLLLRLKAA
jgi:hypothetical protein